MAGLDKRGDISIAILVLYPFILALAIVLVLRHGFSKKMGWLYLAIFSLCKVVGASLHIAAEEVTPVNTGLYTGAFILEGIGLTPLLLCTFSFVSTVGADIIGTPAVPSFLTHTRMKLLHILLTVAAILLAVGAAKATSTDSDDRSSSGMYRKVGGILMTVGFIVIVLVHSLFWKAKDMLQHYQRHLLMGISCALPFLAIRVLYTLLGTFSQVSLSSLTTGSSSSSGLSEFNFFTGSWVIYLVMGTLMELIVISIYIIFGLQMDKYGNSERRDIPSPQYRQFEIDTEMDPTYGAKRYQV